MSIKSWLLIGGLLATGACTGFGPLTDCRTDFDGSQSCAASDSTITTVDAALLQK